MNENREYSSFLKKLADKNLIGSKKRIHYYLNDHLFKEINFEGKNVLDVGGGRGIYSCIALTKGARNATILEPIAEGSNEKMETEFQEIVHLLPMHNPSIRFINSTFQDFQTEEKYDLILFHNSVNHLNEEACIKLPVDSEAVEAYTHIFKKLYEMTHKGTIVIISDASRRNFFNDLGIKNPLRPSIEWEKHCQPQDWLKLLESAGFSKKSVLWRGPNHLGKIGGLFFNNFLGSYLTMSSFVIMVTR